MDARVLMPLAEGFEDIEAFTVIDVLRRAGVALLTAGTAFGYIKSKCNVKVIPDINLDDVSEDILANIQMIVLPGGLEGANHLKNDKRVRDIINALHEKQKYISAICAAPTVLSAIGLTDGRKVTSYPLFKEQFKNYSTERVIVDGNLITSQGPGTSMDFAFTVLDVLCGESKVLEIKKQMLV